LDDIILGNKILLSKKYSVGTVYMLEMPGDMITVIAFDKNNNSLCAQGFFYTEKLKKSVLKNARQYFKKVQECLYQKKLDMIEGLDFD
jgi:hypothetical protein